MEAEERLRIVEETLADAEKRLKVQSRAEKEDSADEANERLSVADLEQRLVDADSQIRTLAEQKAAVEEKLTDLVRLKKPLFKY